LRKLIMKQLADIKGQHNTWTSDAALFFREKFYGAHPYARSRYGTEESVKTLTEKDAREYWFSVLNPQNMVIAASGPIPVDVMERKISKYFGKLKPPEKSLPQIEKVRAHKKSDEFVKSVDREQVTLVIGFDGCSFYNEDDKWPLSVASALLSGTGGLSGWLSVELRGKRNLVYVVWASLRDMRYGGDFSIMTQCQPEDLDTVKSIILAQIERLKSGDFSQDDVSRITEALAKQFLMSRQSQEDLVSSAALDELHGLGFDYSDKYPQKIRSVSRQDVMRVANKYMKYPIVVMLKPLD